MCQACAHKTSRSPKLTKRSKKLAADIGTFMKQYGRKKRPGQGEPNDRKYSRSLERKIKQMPPDELDRILRDDDEDA